jgi:hypothetical protein
MLGLNAALIFAMLGLAFGRNPSVRGGTAPPVFEPSLRRSFYPVTLRRRSVAAFRAGMWSTVSPLICWWISACSPFQKRPANHCMIRVANRTFRRVRNRVPQSTVYGHTKTLDPSSDPGFVAWRLPSSLGDLRLSLGPETARSTCRFPWAGLLPPPTTARAALPDAVFHGMLHVVRATPIGDGLTNPRQNVAFCR